MDPFVRLARLGDLGDGDNLYQAERAPGSSQFQHGGHRGPHGQVDANTTAIQTLTGEVAVVTEKPADENANQQIIQSNPSDDEVAAAALAKELVAAGWKAGDFSVNDIDRSIRTDQGHYPFGDRIDGGGADECGHSRGGS